MSIPVFDLHCDTALALLGNTLDQAGSLRKNELHIDLERAAALGGYCQCFACFTSTWEKLPAGLTVADMFEREMVVILREIESRFLWRICVFFPVRSEKTIQLVQH